MRFHATAVALVLLAAFAAYSPARSQQSPSEKEPSAQENKGRPNNQQKANSENSTAQNSPSAFDFFTSNGLEKISAYCAAKPDSEPDKWLHEKFICDVHVTDVMVAIFTALLVFVTIPLTLIGIWQGWLTRSTARRQLRAYLSINPTFIENYGTKKVITVNCKVKNHGQTPAFAIRYKFTIEVMAEGLPHDFDYPPPQREVAADSTAFPSGDSGGMVAWFNNDRVLTVDEFKQVESGTHRVYVWGLMTYRDAFRKRRETQLNFSFGGPDFVKTMQNVRAGGKQAGPGYVMPYGPKHNQGT